MIQITQTEAEQVQKLKKQNKLKIASERKRHGGKTYYLLNDDTSSLFVVAEMRRMTSEELLRMY